MSRSYENRWPVANAHWGKVDRKPSGDSAQRAALINYLKEMPLSELQRVVDLVAGFRVPARSAYRVRTDALSTRESQVLVLVANGYSRSEISHTLDISPNTAARHIANIYRKLDISTVAEATTYAIAAGLVAIKEPNVKPN